MKFVCPTVKLCFCKDSTVKGSTSFNFLSTYLTGDLVSLKSRFNSCSTGMTGLFLLMGKELEEFKIINKNKNKKMENKF